MPNNTKLLLHLNGSDASTSIVDSGQTGHSLSVAGNAQLDTAQKKFGTASLLLDGTGDWVTVPDHADWDFGTGEFTIDFWVRFASLVSSRAFYQQRVDDNNRVLIYWDFGASELCLYAFSGGVTISNMVRSWSPSINTWYHVAVVRTGNTARMFIDGTQIGADFSLTGTMPDLEAGVSIGGRSSEGDLGLNGWLDEFRIVKGEAKWTTNFTPPTSEYPNSSASPSPSNSPSVSISSSISPSPSSSISLSPSLSGSPSPSLSPSSSQSPSSSESRSTSLSPSVSISSSFSLSPSTSISASISPSQPPGSGLYSKQSSVSLPTTKNDLSIIYGEEDEDNVSTDDGVRVSIEGDNNYLIHQFKVINTNATDTIRARINLQSSLAPTTSPVYLQVWKVSSSQWETVDTDSTSPVNTDFDLTALIDTNQENYYDTDYEVAFRVYQLRV